MFLSVVRVVGAEFSVVVVVVAFVRLSPHAFIFAGVPRASCHGGFRPRISISMVSTWAWGADKKKPAVTRRDKPRSSGIEVTPAGIDG